MKKGQRDLNPIPLWCVVCGIGVVIFGAVEWMPRQEWRQARISNPRRHVAH